VQAVTYGARGGWGYELLHRKKRIFGKGCRVRKEDVLELRGGERTLNSIPGGGSRHGASGREGKGVWIFVKISGKGGRQGKRAAAVKGRKEVGGQSNGMLKNAPLHNGGLWLAGTLACRHITPPDGGSPLYLIRPRKNTTVGSFAGG